MMFQTKIMSDGYRPWYELTPEEKKAYEAMDKQQRLEFTMKKFLTLPSWSLEEWTELTDADAKRLNADFSAMFYPPAGGDL